MLRYLQILRIYRHAGIKYLHCKCFAINTYGCICHYPPVFSSRYLRIPTSICLYFCQKYIEIHSDPAGRFDRVFIPYHRGAQASSSFDALAAPSAGAATAPAAPEPLSSSSSSSSAIIFSSRSSLSLATATLSFWTPDLARCFFQR